MKRTFNRILCCFIFLITLYSFIACSPTKLYSGNYFAVEKSQINQTPYLYLNTENKTFLFCLGIAVSYGDGGSYEIKNETLIATSKKATYKFKIKDEKTLVLLKNGYAEYFQIPINTEFIFTDEN